MDGKEYAYIIIKTEIPFYIFDGESLANMIAGNISPLYKELP